jgi:Na+-translocating ferredoxin:NAD+ oxidoreductase subunit D
MIQRITTLFAPAQSLIGPEPLELKVPRRRAMGSVIGHTGFNVARYHTTHVFGALFPLLAGALFFGWRAITAVLIVVGTTLLGGFVWRRIGTRGHPLRPAQLLWLGVVMAMMLPANLLAISHRSPWPILPIAGLSIVILCWAIGGLGSGLFHPAVVVYLLIALVYRHQLASQTMLQRNHLISGDLLGAAHELETRAFQVTWRKRPILPNIDAIHSVPPAAAMSEFSNPYRRNDTERISLDALLRDRVPPLQDVVLGAIPGSIGVTSAVAVIIGGLFLLYRGLIDFRIPLMITAAAWLALLVLPIPEQSQWQWVPGRIQGIGWAMGVTWANYQVLASPLLFTAFFLAGSPSVRPLSKRGRTIYAITIGLLTAALQLYVSVALGSYLALLIVGLTTPILDRFCMARPLV